MGHGTWEGGGRYGRGGALKKKAGKTPAQGPVPCTYCARCAQARRAERTIHTERSHHIWKYLLYVREGKEFAPCLPSLLSSHHLSWLLLTMGKKACLKLDMEYDSWTDDDHDGYEDIDLVQHQIEYDQDEVAESVLIRTKGVKSTHITDAPSLAQQTSFAKDGSSQSGQILTVITPKMSSQQILYIPNPHRRPLFTDHIAASDGLLVHVVSFLDLIDVLNLSITSKQLREALSKDGLYCNNANQNYVGDGILLPNLYPVAHRLLPIDLDRGRPCGIAQQFAYECMKFHQSSVKDEQSSFEPKKVLSMNLPEHTVAMSCSRVRWEQSSFGLVGKGRSAPTQTFAWQSGIRLSYVTNESNKWLVNEQ